MRFFIYSFLFLLFAGTVSRGQSYTYKGLRFEFQGLNRDTIAAKSDLIFKLRVKTLTAGVRYYTSMEYGPNNVYGNFYYKILRFDPVQSKWVNVTDSLRPVALHLTGPNGEYNLLHDLPRTPISERGGARVLPVKVYPYIGALEPRQYLIRLFVRVDTDYGKDPKGTVILDNIHYLASQNIIFYVNNWL